MKQLIIIGTYNELRPIDNSIRQYLAGASCPISVTVFNNTFVFQWNDEISINGYPAESIHPRPVDRLVTIMDSIIRQSFSLSEDECIEMTNRLESMKHDDILEFNIQTKLYGHTVNADKDGVTVSWIILKEDLDFQTATKEVQKNYENGYPLAIRINNKIIPYQNLFSTSTLITAEEALSSDWELIALTKNKKDDAALIRLQEIRGLLKTTNYLGLKHEVIDKMSMIKIWKKLSMRSYSEEKLYKMIKAIINIKKTD